MPNHHTVQLAIKYASRLRMIQLAERLTEVARQKAEEELILAQRALQRADDDEIDDDDDDDVQHGEDIEYVMFEWLYSYIIELQSHC